MKIEIKRMEKIRKKKEVFLRKRENKREEKRKLIERNGEINE